MSSTPAIVELYYGRIRAFFARIGEDHPGFEEIQLVVPPGFIPTRYDNGIRWMSRLGQTKRGDWQKFSTETSTECQGKEYRTKEDARHALVISFGKAISVSLCKSNRVLERNLTIDIGERKRVRC